MFDPQGMRPFLADWETVSRSLLQRVQREAVGRVIDDETRQLLDDLLAAMRRATGKRRRRRRRTIIAGHPDRLRA